MEKFDAAGAKLIAIGVGTPDKARILADRVRDLVLYLCTRREWLAAEFMRCFHCSCRFLLISCTRTPIARLLPPS